MRKILLSLFAMTILAACAACTNDPQALRLSCAADQLGQPVLVALGQAGAELTGNGEAARMAVAADKPVHEALMAACAQALASPPAADPDK
ncbi:MAG: hypothetical protein HY055_09740 [Magnetospirillum sp.]|nr:hypothetical protein [Magnetospirillum sp.]